MAGRLRTGRGRAARRAAAAGVLLLVTASCGVRSTDVPVDAGPAPTLATCDAPQVSEAVPLHLVCGSQVEAVQRRVPGGTDLPDRVELADLLLRELKKAPPRAEQAAGFSSAVPRKLRAVAPAEGDPEQLVRLNRNPKELTAAALAQIICTFADYPALNEKGAVTLGGPVDDERYTWESYRCTTSLRQLADDGPAVLG